MKIEINSNSDNSKWTVKVYDGPDGIDDAIFNCDTLGECFEKIVEFRIMNSLTYAEDVKESIKDYFGGI